MSVFQAAFLGFVQGLTEFLPISSSGHLFLLPRVFGWDQQNLVFDTTLHLGTLFAVLLYFFSELKSLLSDLYKDFSTSRIKFKKYSQKSRFLFMIVLGSLPAAFLGYFFDNFFEDKARQVTYVLIYLAVGTFLMFLAEMVINKRSKFLNNKYKTQQKGNLYESLNFLKSFIIGVFQSLALFPGVSRSGATISGGIFTGLSREDSARFSFLLSIPIILGASIFKIVDTISFFNLENLLIIVTGFVFSLLSGIFAINVLLNFLKTKNLWIFIIYRILLIIVLLTYTLI